MHGVQSQFEYQSDSLTSKDVKSYSPNHSVVLDTSYSALPSVPEIYMTKQDYRPVFNVDEETRMRTVEAASDDPLFQLYGNRRSQQAVLYEQRAALRIADCHPLLYMILQAAHRIRHDVQTSPIADGNAMIQAPHSDVRLKQDYIQATGSFKIRGATNAIRRLSSAQLRAGVVVASAGNHGAGAGYAAGRGATVFMPEQPAGSAYKAANIRSTGAIVVQTGQTYDESYAAAQAYMAAYPDKTFVHAFDDPYVVAGQGTLALEILDQVPNISSVYGAVGGGGLMGATSEVMAACDTSIEVVGVQLEHADAMRRSLAAGKLISMTSVDRFSDATAVKTAGTLGYELLKRHTAKVITVSVVETARALVDYEREFGVRLEAASGMVLAALRHDRQQLRGTVVGLMTGANISDADWHNTVLPAAA